ncbi:MAG TPA: carboxypeptidase-like regulatory domain-containing protein [Chitinophagales bacterium]|nr:carboxypeptidase-like regulatory domain-containing protein [Chitinophagales bacterium]
MRKGITQIKANTGKAIVLSMLCVLCSVFCSAQLNYDYTAGKFLVKGKVIDVQSKAPVPYANVIFTKNNKGITCDNEGNFTLYVYKTDTLKFTSMGYIGKILHISDIDSSMYYTMEVQLIHDFVKLKDVVIYPFKSREEFIDAFMDNKEEKLQIAGIAPPKYSRVTPKAKFYNPISFLYDRVKKRRAANPDFKP